MQSSGHFIVGKSSLLKKWQRPFLSGDSRLSYDRRFISKRLLALKKTQFDERKQDWLVQKFGLRAEHQLLLLTQEIKRRLCSQGVICGVQSQLTVNGQGISGCTLWTVSPFGFFLIEEGKRKLLPEFCQNFEVTTSRTAGPDNLVSICLVINWRFAIPRARLLGLDSKMYPSSVQCIFNNDLTQFMCRVFLKYIKTEQVEERLSWKDALRLGASSLEHPGCGAIPLESLLAA